MYCPVCKGSETREVFTYKKPDKYEKFVGIKDVERNWYRCGCGFYWQDRNYDLSRLEKIYDNGYRDVKFRNETIEEVYNRISKNPTENEERYFWFAKKVTFEESEKILDIGSGLGVWPAILKRAGHNVTCTERNEHSVNFIYEKLGIKCYQNKIPKGKYDAVSVIHVLEHIEDVDGFLKQVHARVKNYLFVEVPDSIEFEYLNKMHDEFSSCHLVFYDVPSLYRALERNGFHVKYIERSKYSDRNLSRILTIATKKP